MRVKVRRVTRAMVVGLNASAKLKEQVLTSKWTRNSNNIKKDVTRKVALNNKTHWRTLKTRLIRSKLPLLH